MSRDQVKRVLLELGWQSLQMLGRCVDAQMRAFRDAIAAPLREEENLYYSQAFLANADYGGLPLLLLHDRYDILNAAIVNMWNNPGDRQAVAVLHRVMVYYAELIGNRRAADKVYKRRALARNNDARVATEQTIVVDPAAPAGSWAQEIFREIAKRLAMARGFDCEFSEQDWQAVLRSGDDAQVTFEICCPALDFTETITVLRAKFEAIAKEVGELE